MDKKTETEITFELTTPIQYAKKGELEAGTFINLKAPTSKNMTECAFLKQAFFRAIGSIPKQDREKAEVPDDGDIDGEAIMSLITMSTGVELGSVLLTARELFTSGLAMVEGEVKLTKPIMDEMSQDDLEAMTGEYLANFTLASALQKMKDNLSPE